MNLPSKPVYNARHIVIRRKDNMAFKYFILIAFVTHLGPAVFGQGNETQKRSGHAGEVVALTLTPDGKTAASGGKDGTVRYMGCAVRTRDRGLDTTDNGIRSEH